MVVSTERPENTAASAAPAPRWQVTTRSPFRASGRTPARKLFQGNRVEKSVVQFENTNNWQIGGAADDEGNVILGMRGSLSLSGCDDLLVTGNYVHTDIPSFRWSQVHTLQVSRDCKKL